MQKGICHLCLKLSDLTFEHVPPKSAFNKSSDLLNYKFDANSRTWVPSKGNPYGVGEYTLCRTCNNETGGTYGQAFCDFVNHIAAQTKGVQSYRNPIQIEYDGFLHRIYKQILVMFCSTNGVKFSENNDLSAYLLQQDSVDAPKNIRIYICHVNRLSNLSSGIQGILNLRTKNTVVLSEILFWPLGYIMSFDELRSNDIEGAYLTEITSWKDYDPNKRVKITIDLFKNFRLTMFPLDFRSKDEIEACSGENIKPPGVFPFIDYEL